MDAHSHMCAHTQVEENRNRGFWGLHNQAHQSTVLPGPRLCEELLRNWPAQPTLVTLDTRVVWDFHANSIGDID